MVTKREGRPADATKRAARPHAKSVWERLEEISARIPPEEHARFPRDVSKNVDHYLYGSPKDEE